MFAIIKTGGKQYKVQVGSIINIEKLRGNVDEEIVLEDVIFFNGQNNEVSFTTNLPIVKAKILSQYKDKKVIVFKKKRRKNYRRKNGHRQSLTTLQILSIN